MFVRMRIVRHNDGIPQATSSQRRQTSLRFVHAKVTAPLSQAYSVKISKMTSAGSRLRGWYVFQSEANWESCFSKSAFFAAMAARCSEICKSAAVMDGLGGIVSAAVALRVRCCFPKVSDLVPR